MKNKLGFYVLIAIMLLCAGLFVFMFINSINVYNSLNIGYDDLKYEELTFEEYKENGEIKEVYVKEYEYPFIIDSISSKSFDLKTLEKLDSNEIINAYYTNTTTKNYQYEFCEVKVNDAYLLRFEDYLSDNKTNQIMGMVLSPVLISCSIVFIIVLLIVLNKNKIYLGDIKYENGHYVEQVKEGYEEFKLGKVKIEYKEYSDTIQVYNSLNLCSLVINGKVYDQYIGAIAAKFTLQTNFENSFRQVINVKVTMDGAKLKLFINDKKVVEKFIALG